MCDYCDCRSHPQIARLSADHDVLQRVVGALGRAAGGVDRDGVTALTSQLRTLLDRHADREERGVIAELRADVDGGYLDRFEAEHRALHRLVAELDGERWRTAAHELGELLAGHIAREESDLFPAAHQLLDPARWEAVDARVGAR